MTDYGYNALTGEYVDMIKAGILDPTKVVRCALENAVSIAGMLLTTEAIVADIPEEKQLRCNACRHGLLNYSCSSIDKREGSSLPFLFYATQKSIVQNPLFL